MKNLKTKEMISAGIMGLTGFVAPFSLICLIYYFTDLTTKPLFPVKYLVATFMVSLVVWLYCFYLQRSIRKYRKQNSLTASNQAF